LALAAHCCEPNNSRHQLTHIKREFLFYVRKIMPSVRIAGRGSPDAISLPEGTAPNSQRTKIWILVPIIVGVLVAAVLIAFVVTKLLRRRQLRQTCEQDPNLTHKKFRRWFKMSAGDRAEEEELQRRAMIDKSLASRSERNSRVDVYRSATTAGEAPLSISFTDGRLDRDDIPGRERSDSTAHESLSDLHVAVPSRSRSPSRSPLLSAHKAPSSATSPAGCPG